MRAAAYDLLRRLAQRRLARAIPLVGLLLLAFLSLSVAVHSPGLLRVDEAVTRALQARRTDALDQVARVMTLMGDTRTLVLLGLLAIAALALSGRRWAALLGTVALLSLPINFLLKDWVGRPRPEAGLVEVLLPAVGLSFPSGHAMGSLTVYGFLALMAWVHVRQRLWRLALVLLLLAIPLLSGLSRVYLGVHWLSDVLGGWTAGLLLLLLLAEAYRLVGRGEVLPASRTGCSSVGAAEPTSAPRPGPSAPGPDASGRTPRQRSG